MLFLHKMDLPMSIKSNWPTHAQFKKHAGPVVVFRYPSWDARDARPVVVFRYPSSSNQDKFSL